MSEVAQAPQLRFPEFSGEWKEKKLDSVVSKFIVPMRDKPTDLTGSIPWCRIEDFDGMYLNQSKTGQGVSEETVKEMNLKVYPINTLLVSCSANLGFCAIVKKELITNQTFIGLQSNDNLINIEFLYYLMKLSSRRLNILSSGTTISYLSRREFENFKITTPSLPEQQKIAAFLTAVDNKIEQLSKKQALLGEYKKGLMQQIFSQAIRFKADDGCDFPDWEEKSLGELFNYKNGGSFENEVVKDGLYNLITLNSITIDGELKNEHKKINSFDNSLKINDLIMVLSDVAHGNFLGLTAIIPEDNSYVLNQRMGALKSKGLNNVVFLRLLINYNQKYFKLHGQGSSQQNLSKGDILKFELLLPNRNEQQKIANFLSSIDTKIEQVGKQLDESKQFKKALLQQMFV